MKIKIKNRGFPTTHYGFLGSGNEYDVSDNFAVYCVEKMKSADYVVKTRKTRQKKI